MVKDKIKIKAGTQKKNKLLLEKSFLLKKNYNTLILNREFFKKDIIKSKLEVHTNNIFDIDSNNNKKYNEILKIQNISKNINGKPILKNISLDLNQGQILGLLGPNGAGKSTLFNLIIGKITPDNGNIIFLNERINHLPVHIRARKGMSLLEQNKGLFGTLTAFENLYAILEISMNDKNKIEAKINSLLNIFNLKYLSDVKADNMSGGEYKKISTLQRICNKNIKVLMLDEPMAALDPLSIASIKKFIVELKSMGLSIIITDHNFYAIHDILDNCIIIKDGSIMVNGLPKEVIKDEKAIKYYLGSDFVI